MPSGTTEDPAPVLARTSPAAPGLSPIQAAGAWVFIDASVAIPDPIVATAAPLGSISLRSVISVSPPDALNRLVGMDARILFGNRSGDVWTDTRRRAVGPAVNLRTDGVADYRAGVEPIDACRDDAVDGVGQSDLVTPAGDAPAAVGRVPFEHAVRDQRANDLLEEERISLGSLDDKVLETRRPVVAGDQTVEKRRGRRFGKLREQDLRIARVADRAGDRLDREGVAVAFRPGDQHEQQRHGRRQRHDVLEQIQRRLVCPMEVLEHQHQRPFARQPLDQQADAAEDLAPHRVAVEGT